MRYVQTNNGVFVRHIRDEFESIRWGQANKTSVRKLTTEEREEFGISRLQMVTPPAFDSASQTRGEGNAVLVGDVWTQNWVVTDLVGDDLEIARSNATIKAAELSKQTGIEILGVLCSATKDDQNGLTAIATGVTLARAASSTFADTVFHFSNGNSLTITDSNFNAIYAAWVPFRQSFFKPPA